MDSSTHRTARKHRDTQPLSFRHPDHPAESARLLCYFGPDATAGKSVDRLRELISETKLPSRIVAYARARRRTENELSLALRHLAPAPHAFLDLHGNHLVRHAVQAGVVSKKGVYTADLLAWMLSQMPRGGSELPVFHLISCKSGHLARDIVPGSDRWRAAYVIVYAGRKDISLGHIESALETGMHYISHCAQNARRVDPFKLFLLAGMRRGDCMTLMGGELEAPVRWHGPKTGADLADTRRLAELIEGQPADIERLARTAGSILPDEEALLPDVAHALVGIFRARMVRVDLPRMGELVRQQPTLVNGIDCTGYPPLHDAAGDHNLPMVDFLLKHGAALDGKDYFGDTALFNLVVTTIEPAKREAAIPVLKRLLDLGADPNDRDRDGCPVLTAAVQMGWTEAVRILLAHDADPNLRHGEISSLSLARKYGDRRIMELLEKAGAREDDS